MRTDDAKSVTGLLDLGYLSASDPCLWGHVQDLGVRDNLVHVLHDHLAVHVLQPFLHPVEKSSGCHRCLPI